METANCLMCGKPGGFPRCAECEADFKLLAYKISVFRRSRNRPELRAVAYLISSYGVSGVCELFDLTKHDVWNRIREDSWADLASELLVFVEALREETDERYAEERELYG